MGIDDNPLTSVPTEPDNLRADAPVLPAYDGACISNLMPALLSHHDTPPAWAPAAALEADRIVLLVLDGLGWDQLARRPHLAPTLSAMAGRSITSVLPSTTATAMTSLTTGLSPGEHGMVGYRMHMYGEVLNVLRWTTAAGDARATIPPQKVQTHLAFLGHRPPVVTRAEFARSGFTLAHLDQVRFCGYRMASTLVTEVRRLAHSGEPFVYAYYEGIDKVGHEYGLGEHYDAELSAADRLVADVLATVPRRTAVVVTSDHGQVDVGDNVTPLNTDVAANVVLQSGEGRFRWLHARPGRASALFDAASGCHGDEAWVVTRDDVIAGNWFGPNVTEEAAARLGDVALVARTDVAFTEPTDTGPYDLVGRHGSATRAEMLVPLLVAVA